MTPRLALVMIARDEARCIARCLHSLRPWVDEMVVVDTGSRDATPELARAAGARLAHFGWIDDFSAARNFALDQTDAAWRLVLDADEWLDGSAAALRTAVEAAPTGGFVGQVEVASDFDDAASVRSASSWISRLLPRGVRYAGRVHEQPQHDLPVRRLALRIGHDGYRDAQRAAKRGRNRRLLEAAWREHPGEPYLLYQLGKEAELDGQPGAAVAAYRAAHAAVRRRPDAPAWLHDLVVRLLFCLKLAGRHEEAVHLADAEMPHWGHSPDFHFALGDLLLDWAAGQPQRAAELLPLIEATWQRCLDIGETPGLEGAVAGRGSDLAEHNLALLRQTVAGLAPISRGKPCLFGASDPG